MYRGYDLGKDVPLNISSRNYGYESNPDIFGDTVVWVDTEDNKTKIYEKNLATDNERIVFQTDTRRLNSPRISNKYIVWVDNLDVSAHDIFAYNRKTEEIVRLCDFGPQGPSPTIPDIFQDTVVWMSWHTTNGDIYGSFLSK